MNERQVAPTDDIVLRQKIAGDPTKSIWVSANAGSGKTHILTERVLRILLSGVAPENILCLTYTKAAAAEMKSRVAKNLGLWALSDDENLAEALYKISGKRPDNALLLRARTLFALALETPGGLKINTIHAFCEAALHRFPLEADVPVDFSVIEDVEKTELIHRATEHVLSKGLNGDIAVSKAVADLFTLLSDDQIRVAVKNALGQGRELREILADPVTAKLNLHQLVGYNCDRTVKIIEDEILEKTLLTPHDCQSLVEVLKGDPNRSLRPRFADFFARMDPQQFSLHELLTAFLTGTGTPRKTLMLVAERKKHTELADLFERERDRVYNLSCEIKAARLVMRSQALLDVMGAIYKHYETIKRATDKLDFDDLIVRFEALLSGKTSSDWVRYKLDAGMTHVLVDESQDTNFDQWQVVKHLVDEFFAGDSAREINRTVFGVGDEKQSIFGFQGAEPHLFDETGNNLKLKAERAGKNWENTRLKASFRTLENILNGVDIVCERQDIRAALLSHDQPVVHESARKDKGGIITLWPPPEKQESPAQNQEDWPIAPLAAFKSDARKTAERIATQIRCWLDDNRPLGARGRPVMADDILILVQTRGPVFQEIIRALKHKNIPTPGADKLSVTGHIVVRDLLVLGDVLINPRDDLSLATLLRSPLFEISERQLEDLCVGRPDTLWLALKGAATTHDWAKIAYDSLSNLRRTLDFERPYEFFAQVLFAHHGLKKFHRRLGEEINEIIDLFLGLALEHEQNSQPSLQGFLVDLRAREIEVKRELSETGGGVRVMTVHGAKGLEAPIVILADATSKQSFRDTVFMTTEPKMFFVHGSKEDHTAKTIEHLREPQVKKETAEYWRKLYVAMTRAEDELYITGFKAPPKDCASTWYGAIEDALGSDTVCVDIFKEEEKGLRFPAIIPDAKLFEHSPAPTKPTLDLAEIAPIDPAIKIETIRPSSALEIDAFDFTAPRIQSFENVPDMDKARLQGVALHSLLQYLGSIVPQSRKSVAQKALAKLLPKDMESHPVLIEKALSILSGPEAEKLFGSDSRAEMPIYVYGIKKEKPVRITGRIDRIVVDGDKMMLVDFKSNASPPAHSNEVSLPYLTQMGLYLRCGEKLFPEYSISTAIYWTGNETLMPLDNAQILGVTNQFNIS